MSGLGIALLLTMVSGTPSYADDAAGLDGQWAGIVHFDKEAFLADTSTPASGTPMGLEIHGPVVRVFVHDDGKDVEVKPGMFHIAPVSANAVIFASDASPDGAWVESWAFVVTKKDDQTLRVEYVRLVKNFGPPAPDAEPAFATRGEGDFKRMGS